MKPTHRLSAYATAAVMLLAMLGSRTASAAPGAPCDLRLTVELTPDVPDASDAGFLSSLLSNHSDYRLELLRQEGPSLIELDLVGPGPEYLCQSVIETMRRDARVLAVRVDSPETPVEESSGVRLSSAGLGSLYWAARHASEAWRVLLPIEPAQPPGEESLREPEAER